jgi:poly-beta-1,6-N-acetyl-D-glucosamine synthase
VATSPPYIVITPVRNEEKCFPRTIESLVTQTIPPAAWIIVDDGSTDQTASIADNAASRRAWIRVVHRSDRGFGHAGAGVIEAFYDGLDQVDDGAWDFLAKIDGDLVLPADYFQRCLERFDRDSRLGIGGGLICRRKEGRLVAESSGDPDFHVRGATKIYRRACWEQIGGLIKAPGWDTVDELKANMLGWKTCTFEELKVHQLKDTGAADGSWRNSVKNGLANYITGYHPLFMLAKCAKRVFSRPYLVGAGALAWGFVSGYLRGVPQVEDEQLLRYLRDQQFRKMSFRRSIWG